MTFRCYVLWSMVEQECAPVSRSVSTHCMYWCKYIVNFWTFQLIFNFDFGLVASNTFQLTVTNVVKDFLAIQWSYSNFIWILLFIVPMRYWLNFVTFRWGHLKGVMRQILQVSDTISNINTCVLRMLCFSFEFVVCWEDPWERSLGKEFTISIILKTLTKLIFKFYLNLPGRELLKNSSKFNDTPRRYRQFDIYPNRLFSFTIHSN